MKKILILIILVFCFPIFAEIPQTFFPELVDNKVLPIHTELGILNENEDESTIVFLKKALNTDFTPEWIKIYINSDCEKALERVFNNYLINALPLNSNDYLISKERKENNYTSISIYIFSDSKILNFLIDDKPKIVSISFD